MYEFEVYRSLQLRMNPDNPDKYSSGSSPISYYIIFSYPGTIECTICTNVCSIVKLFWLLLPRLAAGL